VGLTIGVCVDGISLCRFKSATEAFYVESHRQRILSI
jgi:hypothetical protein